MEYTGQNRIQSFAFVISVCIAACCSFGFISNHHKDSEQRAIKLEGRINPNNAPIESLVRLPGLGIGRAGAIIAYRKNFERTAFQNCNDLLKVKGIGPKTLQNISEWLKFN